MKPLKDLLKDARAEAGYTQKQIADKFGYDSAQFVSNWERGVSSPPLKTLKKLAALYHIDATVLFETVLDQELRSARQKVHKAFGKKIS